MDYDQVLEKLVFEFNELKKVSFLNIHTHVCNINTTF